MPNQPNFPSLPGLDPGPINPGPTSSPSVGIATQLDGPTPKGLSLQGDPGPTFENENQISRSKIHALTNSSTLVNSEDLLTGRIYGPGQYSTLAPPSQPPVSFPDNFVGKPYYQFPLSNPRVGTYKETGPSKGRY